MTDHLAHLTDPETPLAIIGLGYVGLPLAVEFAKHRPVIGFDINRARIAELQAGHDSTRETSPEDLAAARHLTYHQRSGRPAPLPHLHRHRAHPGRRLQAARSHAAHQSLRDRRPGPQTRRPGHLRVHRLPRLHRGGLRARPGATFRASVPVIPLSPALPREGGGSYLLSPTLPARGEGADLPLPSRERGRGRGAIKPTPSTSATPPSASTPATASTA